MQRAFTDAAVGAGSGLVVVLALVTFDERVRDQIRMTFDTTHPQVALHGVSTRLSDLAAVMAMAMHQQSFAHAPLVIFAVAAAVLVLFMVRT
jgi:alpha-beta hydrolase superfamily lysophospholipase